MEKLRLKKIIPVRFNKLEATNFRELWRSRAHGPALRSLKKGECVCFISKNKSCISFVSGYVRGETDGQQWTIFPSRRHRIERGPGLSNEFEPLMLGNYARHLGIELIGIQLFEEYFKK